MKLMFSAASPFVRMVRIAAIELDLADEMELVPASSTPLGTEDAALLAANPTGKIPALIRDDGPAIYDSRVIMRYLNARASGTLYPEARLWEVLTLEATAHAITEATILVVYDARFRGDGPGREDYLAGQWLKITRGLAAVEGRWMSHLSGPLDAAQIAMAATLGYLDFRQAQFEWRSDYPHLAKWYEGICERPSMQTTQP